MSRKKEQEPAPLEAEFLAWLDRRDFSSETLRAYGWAVRDFWRRRPDGIEDYESVKLKDLERYLTLLKTEKISAQTCRARAYALKSFFQFLIEHDHIKRSPAMFLREPFRKLTETTPVFTTEEIEKLIFSWNEPTLERGGAEPEAFFERRQKWRPFIEARDTACLALAYTCGLRVSELGGLELRDYDTSEGKPVLVIRQAKWAKEPKGLDVERRPHALVERYLAYRTQMGVISPALFPAVATAFLENGAGITARYLRVMLARRIAQAGIVPKGRHLHFHVFRYSVCTHAADAGARLERLQIYMRHRQLSTTARYLRLGRWGSIQKQIHHMFFWNVRRTTPKPS